MLTIAAGCISIYYMYKETREYAVKYLENADETTFRYMKIYTVGSTAVFTFLFRYYFLAA